MGPTRLYERYNFAATAEIIDGSGAHFPSQATNISFGGCRLVTNGRLPIGASVTIKIRTAPDDFEAPAQVVHSTASDAGVMFGKFTAQSLFVLEKWINEAKSATTAPQP